MKDQTAKPLKFYINGDWRMSTLRRQVFNPFQSAAVEEVCHATAKDISEAIGAAAGAFQELRRLPASERAQILKQMAAEVEARRDEFAQLITSETGKPISFSRAEVSRAILTLTTSSEEAKRLEGTVLPLDILPEYAERFALTRRFPIGVVSAITPFNFPLNLVAHKVGPALACGNPLVLKPSSNAPGVALRLADVASKTSLPKGAFNVVPCMGSEAEQLITDKRVKLISFTGSPVVGWGIKARAGKKRVVLELGGNAAVIICPDANIEYALQRTLLGAFGNAGQSCIAVQRIYIHESIAGAVTDKFVKLARSLAAGDPLNERTVVGPMIDEQAAERVEDWIKQAVNAGAEVLCGGNRKKAMLEPTVLKGVPPDAAVSCQEVFAPVVTIDTFVEFKDAIARVNDSPYGLQTGIFTNSMPDIFYAFRELEVGGVIVNDASSFRADHMPYGGVKDSGFGREGVRYAIEEMTELKLLALNFT